MDLCCLIDSEDRLPATALVNMLGDLFARGTPQSIHGWVSNIPLVHRNEVPHQTTSPCANTDRQAFAESQARATFRYCL